MITETGHANEIITGGDADLVFLARELLRQPYWTLRAQQELGVEPCWPIPYLGYAVRRRAVEPMAILLQPKLTPSSCTESRKPSIRHQRGSEPWPGVSNT